MDDRNLLSPVLEGIGQSLKKVQQEGKEAFDRDDPEAAKRAAHRLEQIDRAEALLQELAELLRAIGVESTEPDPGRDEDLRRKPITRKKGRGRLKHRATQPDEFRQAVVELLRESGGEAGLESIRTGISGRFGDRFSPSDLEPMPNSPLLRWQYNLQWTLTHLKNDGVLVKGKKRGLWRLIQ